MLLVDMLFPSALDFPPCSHFQYSPPFHFYYELKSEAKEFFCLCVFFFFFLGGGGVVEVRSGEKLE
jgi:hypothetical protein